MTDSLARASKAPSEIAASSVFPISAPEFLALDTHSDTKLRAIKNVGGKFLLTASVRAKILVRLKKADAKSRFPSPAITTSLCKKNIASSVYYL